ncbi:terpene synthase family protein [Chitinophaga varians]|uniref:terpene synthase family protein n=1 Tax=Chitinophaga varians TaxID=2202339 RepID=UPI00165FBA0D|nr:terpene synthase [Chitinophaga varians]MBC9908989.1 terpene synthase [Chitinophaga varians]
MNALELLRTQFRYPFPTLKNPYADQLQEITDQQWIDGEYLWLYELAPGIREKYKKTKTAHIASQWFPTASFERLRPLGRLMLWTLYNDDLYEESNPERIDYVQEQSIAVLTGEISAGETEIPLGQMLATLRAELRQFIPQESIIRFANMIHRYFSGLKRELMYKKNKTFPTVAECIALREDSICLYPFLQLTEVETGIVLPPEIHSHPVILRLQALACHLVTYFNEVQSAAKDEATDSIYYNIVKVIQHQYKISLEEAFLEDLRLHNEDLKEFITLQATLPDFGIWQDAVVNWVHYMSMVLSGWKNISTRLDRYNTIEFPSASELKDQLHQKQFNKGKK